MDFETFFAAVMARVETRSGMDTDAPGFKFVCPKHVLRELLRTTFEYAIRDGKPDEGWVPPSPS